MNDAMARHSEPEVLAAFVDGKLTREELDAVTEHLTTCEDCRTLVGAAVGFGRAEGAAAVGRKARWWIPLAAAAAIAVGVGIPLWQRMSDPMRQLQPKDHRTIPARLTAFDYAPLKVMRGGEEENWRAMAAAAELQERLQKNRTSENLHKYALAEIVLGKTNDAAQLLVEASRMEPQNARILSDLAAAQCALLKFADCAETADRAQRHDPSLAPAAFNRALALQKSGKDQAAAAAWQGYLHLDPSSAWAAEAKSHLQKLQDVQAP